jgi:mannose-6-phosphate isomerase
MARLSGTGFDSIHLPSRGIAAIPAAAPPFTVEDLGELDLIRMSPRWPEKNA